MEGNFVRVGCGKKEVESAKNFSISRWRFQTQKVIS
jgi:hypothetical protein